jgi:hypothetical protein
MHLRILASALLALAVVTPAAARNCTQFGDMINCDDGSTIHLNGPFVGPQANWDESPFYNGLANAQMPTPAAKRPTGSPRGRQHH